MREQLYAFIVQEESTQNIVVHPTVPDERTIIPKTECERTRMTTTNNAASETALRVINRCVIPFNEICHCLGRRDALSFMVTLVGKYEQRTTLCRCSPEQQKDESEMLIMTNV